MKLNQCQTNKGALVQPAYADKLNMKFTLIHFSKMYTELSKYQKEAKVLTPNVYSLDTNLQNFQKNIKQKKKSP